MGAKNHTALGLNEEIRGRAVDKEAPQFMKPMPMGRVPLGGLREAGRSVRAWVRWVCRSETSVPAPMKPRPPGGF